jgi:L-threonylcarbamoyladenylate synthase
MSPVFDCTTEHGRVDGIAKAAAGVREGKLVVLPTDTLYGIGADAFAPDAVRDLLAAKGRGSDMPPPVLVPEVRTVDGLATDVPDYARALVAAFWPGPLTVVLRAQPSLMWDLGDTGGTVALRMPDHPVALELLREVGPMAVSSANRTGYPASRTVVEAASQLGAAVEFYLDGGPVTGGLASTIVDCTREEPVFLRVGALSEQEVMDVVERARTDALELTGAEPDQGGVQPDQPHDTVEPDEQHDTAELDQPYDIVEPDDSTGPVDRAGPAGPGSTEAPDDLDETGAHHAPTASEQRETSDD